MDSADERDYHIAASAARMSMSIQRDEFGVIRVGGTRVTLDTIVTAHQQGETPEVIADQYPAVTLADVHAAIAYYYSHREEVEAYFEERTRRAEEVRRKHSARFSQNGLREELLARRAASQES